MAKICKTNEQEIALKSITEDLKMVEKLNTIIKSEKSTTSITYSVGDSKVTIPFEFEDAVKNCKDLKKKLVSEIKASSKKFAISLSENEEQTIAD